MLNYVFRRISHLKENFNNYRQILPKTKIIDLSLHNVILYFMDTT